MIVQVTEFHLPNGRQTTLEIRVPTFYQRQYQAIIQSGCRLTRETLRTGEVSQTVEGTEFDYDIIVTPNEVAPVYDALIKLISRFSKTKYAEEVATYACNEE